MGPQSTAPIIEKRVVYVCVHTSVSARVKTSGQSTSVIFFFNCSLTFLNIVFLLTTENFTLCTPNTLTSQSSQVSLPYLVTYHTPKKVQFVLSMYSLEPGQTPSSQPLKETESFPTCTHARSMNCGELHFSILTMLFKSSIPWLPD